jgi:hypothetical protein
MIPRLARDCTGAPPGMAVRLSSPCAHAVAPLKIYKQKEPGQARLTSGQAETVPKLDIGLEGIRGILTGASRDYGAMIFQ